MVFAKYARPVESASAPAQSQGSEQSPSRVADRTEFFSRLIAFPAALIGARLLVSLVPAVVRMLSMWIHESGHAATAWLCGFPAFPGPWFTPVGTERMRILTILLAGLIVFGGIRAWRNRRWGLAVTAAAVLAAQLACTFELFSDQAQQLIIFGGDGGCFVLGSILMAMFYVRRESILYQNSLRWAFVIIGALAFMDAFAVWSGGIAAIPFGENENGMSDPSVLTENYGWTVALLMGRYQRLSVACLISLGIVYLAGLVPVLAATKTESTDLKQVEV